MASVNLSVPAPKEIVDALVKMDELVGKLMAKEPISQLIIEELAAVVQLAGEVSALPSDLQNSPDQCLDAGALFGRRIVYRMMGKPVVPVSIS